MPRHRSPGFSLVEFMIAITLSLIVLAALTGTFVANSKARGEIEKANDQIESGRFSLALLSSDIEMAGFLDRLNIRNLEARGYAIPTAKPNACASDLASLRAAIVMPVQGYNDEDPSPGIPTTCVLDRKAGTDVLVIRRAATCVGGTGTCSMVTNAPYFQASLCGGAGELASTNPADYFRLDTTLANLNRTQRNCTAQAVRRQYLTNIYYIANNDMPNDGIPTLKRAELGGDADGDGTADVNASGLAFSIMPVAHGIENLQLEYGLDSTANDGAPEVFTDSPDRYDPAAPATLKTGCAANTNCIANWRNVTAIKVSLLSRNTSETKDYTDNKVHVLGTHYDGSANGVAKCANGTAPSCAAMNDHYKRHVYTATVRLQNIAGRRE